MVRTLCIVALLCLSATAQDTDEPDGSNAPDQAQQPPADPAEELDKLMALLREAQERKDAIAAATDTGDPTHEAEATDGEEAGPEQDGEEEVPIDAEAQDTESPTRAHDNSPVNGTTFEGG